MKVRKIKIFIYTFVFLLLLILISPMCLYSIGLHGVKGRPIQPSISATEDEKERVKSFLRIRGEIDVTPTNPYEYIYLLLNSGSSNSGLSAIWMVAANHNLGNLKYKGNGWWHLSGAALTIWLSRNWTTDQVITKIVEIKYIDNG